MKTKDTYLFWIFISVIICIGLPFFLKENGESANQTLSIISTLLSTLASLLTLFIAVVLFKKYGIESTLIQKQSEIVFSFIEEYKKTEFIISGKIFSIFISIHQPIHHYFEEHYETKLVFSVEYFDDLAKLFKIAESPFMPKIIYDKISNLRFITLSHDVDAESLDLYAKVTVRGKNLHPEKFGRFNSSDLTLFEFLNILEDIRSELINWVTKNSDFAPDLNL